jgi:hypothetical protein
MPLLVDKFTEKRVLFCSTTQSAQSLIRAINSPICGKKGSLIFPSPVAREAELHGESPPPPTLLTCCSTSSSSSDRLQQAIFEGAGKINTAAIVYRTLIYNTLPESS